MILVKERVDNQLFNALIKDEFLIHSKTSTKQFRLASKLMQRVYEEPYEGVEAPYRQIDRI